MMYPNNNEKYFFEINKDQYNLFYFNLKDKNGNIYLGSGSYTQKTNSQNGIKSVIRNSKNKDRFDIKFFLNGLYVVYLKDGNGDVIAIGADLFTNKEEAKNFIKNFKNLSLKTPVIDNTKLKN